MTRGLDRLERFVLLALAYLAFSGVWIYGVIDTGVLEGRGVLGWTAVALVALAHVAFGFAIREWAALLLPIALIFLAVPAGYPESDFEPTPLWISQTFVVIVEIPLIAAGLGLRALAERRRASIRSS
jgi:hypothetical protein